MGQTQSTGEYSCHYVENLINIDSLNNRFQNYSPQLARGGGGQQLNSCESEWLIWQCDNERVKTEATGSKASLSV